MKSGIILYQSKYGATKKYAQALAKATGFDYMETKGATLSHVSGADTLVLMGGVYASGIAGLNFLKKHIGALKEKHIYVFAVGASPWDESAIQQCKDHNLKGDLASLPLFYGRGMWNLKGMTFGDRTLCKLLQKAVAKQDPSTYEPWQTALMNSGDEGCDWTDESYLQPLLQAMGFAQA